MERSRVSDSGPGWGRLHLENTEFRFLGLLGVPGAYACVDAEDQAVFWAQVIIFLKMVLQNFPINL